MLPRDFNEARLLLKIRGSHLSHKIYKYIYTSTSPSSMDPQGVLKIPQNF
jgi:hypothetical protein